MSYQLCDIPDSGPNPIVFFDISLKEECLGRLWIRLHREVFPAGVENFVKIASGTTYKTVVERIGDFTYKRDTRRTYEGCKFFSKKYNNYLVSGDIYNNDGTTAGTIYEDEPIPALFGPYFYPHDRKGLISLVPFVDETTGENFYDSTFMITLDRPSSNNVIASLDCDQIVIGEVYCDNCLLDKMNELIKPYAGRRYPDFVISNCGVKNTSNARRRPVPLIANTDDFINNQNNIGCNVCVEN